MIRTMILYLGIYLPTDRPIYLSIFLPTDPSIYPSTFLSINLSEFALMLAFTDPWITTDASQVSCIS